MDIEALRLFLDAWKLGSFTAAANQNFVTQSTLSKRIALLEQELGVTLFQRGKGQAQVTVTPMGEAFSDIAERILMLYGQACALQNEGIRQILTIACIRSAQDAIFPQFLLHLKAIDPRLCITIEDHHTTEIFPLLENRRVDIGITQSQLPSKSLSSQLLYQETYCVVLQKDQNRFYAGEPVHPTQLSERHEIFQAFDRAHQLWHDQWWRPFAAKMRVNTTSTAELYFSHPEDWMIVPAATARAMEKRGFSVFPLLENPPSHCVFLTYHRQAGNQAIPFFLSELTDYCNQSPLLKADR